MVVLAWHDGVARGGTGNLCSPPSALDCVCVLQLEPQFSAKIQELLQQEQEACRKGHRERQEAIGHKVDLQVGTARCGWSMANGALV